MSKAKTRTQYIIRTAETGDLPELVQFMVKLALHVAGSEPLELKESETHRLTNALRAMLDAADKQIFVAEVPGVGLVGMGDIRVWSSQGIWEQTRDVEYRSGVIDDVWIEPEFRSMGIFKALLKHLVEFAASHGAQELILEYSASNKEAKAAWSKLGFKTTGVRAAAFTQHLQEKLV